MAAEETIAASFIEKYSRIARGRTKAHRAAEGRLAKLERSVQDRPAVEVRARVRDVYRASAGLMSGERPACRPVVRSGHLPKDCDILYINDSKKLSAAKRENCTM